MRLLQLLFSIIFPSQCCHCGRYGLYLCKHCRELLDFLDPTTRDLHHLAPSVDTLTAATTLTGPIRSLVHAVKYSGYRCAAQDLADLLYTHAALPEYDVVVPIPMHWYKRWQRGYNQAEEIAQHLAKLHHKPLLPLLIRQKYSAAQASVHDKSERQHRLAHVFALNPLYAHQDFSRLKILLVDDVITTGSTLEACATVLRTKKPLCLHGVGIAHGK